MKKTPENIFANKRVVIALFLLLTILILFPVTKTQKVTYIGKGGSAGTIEKQRLAPWWFPEAFLKRSVPLEDAPVEDVKKLIDKAYKSRDVKKLKIIERSYPKVHDLVYQLEKSNGSSSGNSRSRNGEDRDNGNQETVVPPSTRAGGTLEARIPATIEGFEFVTESRSLLSWVGVFKSKDDLNIQSLEVTIELLGKKGAESELEKFVSAYEKFVQEVNVKGIKAYFVPITSYEARLIFKDGDFLYEFKLVLGGGAQNYKEKLRQIAERAYL